MKTLYDWQEADVQEALKHDSWFIAYEMGLGKTLVAVEWAKRKGGVKTTIIVAPLNTFDSWEREIKSQIPDATVYRLLADNNHVSAFGYLKQGWPGFYLIGWEMMRTGAITGQRADLIIADETHKQANFGKSDQSILIREIDSKYKLALSGTPAANSPAGIFATLNWLWPKLYKSYWNWVDRYWRSIRNGSVITLVRELKPGYVVSEIPMFSRRLRKDHRQDMPRKLAEIPIGIELLPAQRKLYDKLAAEAGVWLDENNFMSTAYSLVEDMRLKELCLAVPTLVDGVVTFKENAKSAKIEKLIEVLEGDEVKDEAFLVLTHSAKIVPIIVARLAKKGIKAVGFTGETKMDARRWALDNLGSEYRVLVAGIAAIGEGTDGLQYKCHNMFWLSKHRNALLNKQAAMRLDRPGQSEPINTWYCYAEDTVEIRQIERLDEIEEALEDMLDNPAV